ncbi:MAG: DUF5522 domain-containing protein [Microthrixaceae bacterium]
MDGAAGGTTSAATRSAPLQPHVERLPLEHPRRTEILRRHARAMRRGSATYRDPDSGYRVFTAEFHLRRGECCDQGCRHCPYLPYDGDSATGPNQETQ